MFKLYLEPSARQDLARLDTTTRQRLAKRLDWFVEHFDEIQPDALTGKWAGYYKFRMGDYRAVYRFDRTQKLVTVYRIRHRREVYE